MTASMANTAGTDRASFERRVLVHLPAAYNLAWLLLRSDAEAEDAVQDATVRAYRAFHQLRGEAAKPWLLAIVRNVCYRRLQQRKRAGNVISLDEAMVPGALGPADDLAFASRERSPEQAVLRAADVSMLHGAIERLPPVFREVIILREIEELSYREIADVIGAPIGTVMSRLARAREELRSTMTRLMNEDDGHAV
jgi:RNA polymerase sigma factor (sigma-70 family)